MELVVLGGRSSRAFAPDRDWTTAASVRQREANGFADEVRHAGP